MLVIKRKLYSKSSSLLRIKEEERLYARLPMRIPRMNNIGARMRSGFTSARAGLDAAWIKGTTRARNLFGSGRRMGFQSNLNQTPKVEIPKPSIDVSKITGVSNNKPTTSNLVINPKITTQNQSILSNLNKPQNNTFTVPRKYNPSADPKMHNTNLMNGGKIGARELSSNHTRGQAYYESLFKEAGVNADSMHNITTSRKSIMEQIKPQQPQTPITPTPKPQPQIDDNKTIDFNEAASKLPQQTKPQPKPAEKPFEITGLAEQQPKTNTSTVEVNNNPQPQTNPTAEPKPQEIQSNKNNTDEKFRLGWKGKTALGLAGLGAATYGGAKLVKNAVDDKED